MSVVDHPQPNLPTGLMTNIGQILAPGVCQEVTYLYPFSI